MRSPFFAAALGLSALSLTLTGCGADTPNPAADTGAESAATGHTFGPDISAEDFSVMVETLSSDEFDGRAPGGRGEELTINYIRDQFQRLGLKPGNGDSWFQTVPMVETTADTETSLVSLDLGDSSRVLNFGGEMVLGTRTGQPSVSVEASELVFVGYGVNAPEAGWNDYEGLDVTGKTVVILVNDPGYHVGDENLFEGRRMTYYGRWTYKYEEAARQGAAAALIIHDDSGAGYGWDVVKNSWSGAQFDLPVSADPEPRLPLQGWITTEVAKELFAQAGLDLEAEYRAANSADFQAKPLAAKLDATVNSSIRQAESQNVLGLLPGSETPDEVVVYMAHWDHLGNHGGQDGEDHIYNGAIDNATGVAGIIEIAEAFASGEPPKRSVLFLAVTLEESGLLGSKYYVANPVLPLANTVATINLDAMSVYGPTSDFTVIGLGNSELEDILTPIAASQNRTLVEEGAPEKGFYFRSDHFNFAKAGVPSLYAKGGNVHVEHGADYISQRAAEYGANRYHKPGDEYDPNWDLRGLIQDLNALYGVGRELTDSGTWPNWYEGNPFRAAREASRASAASDATE
ncbi:MAG: M28 family metallopeptidase [Xanthomonadaceae bacterium]|nr:M28 family metallopeptidase [Xanthomonadaceae bacterium]